MAARPGLTAITAGKASMAHAMKQRAATGSILRFVKNRKTGRAYIEVRRRDFPEVLAIGSPEANAYLRAQARAKGQQLRQRDLDELNQELLSQAEDAGEYVDLFARVSLVPGGVEIDINDGAGTTVLLAHGRVEVLKGSSTQFIRPASSMALPVPATDGDFSLLQRYVNFAPDTFMLYVAWLAFIIASPKVESTKYVFLVIKGTQGTGKTYASKTTQRLVDPSSIGVQTLPGTGRDLAIMLQACHLLVVDNLRDLSAALSDMLCIAATGGSAPMRKLYTDDEQKALYLHGAIVFNGIHPFIGQADFADRCLVLELKPIPPERRQSEAQMLAQFELDCPVILRGLYDLIVQVQLLLPTAKVVAPSRMLDFCRWLAAVECALGYPVGVLQYLYAESITESQLESLLDNPLAVVILKFAEELTTGEWTGTPADFYEQLTGLADLGSQRSRAWPTSAAVLGKRLHGLQAPLQAQGVSIEWTRGKERQITVRRLATTLPTSPVAAAGPVTNGGQ